MDTTDQDDNQRLRRFSVEQGPGDAAAAFSARDQQEAFLAGSQGQGQEVGDTAHQEASPQQTDRDPYLEYVSSVLGTSIDARTTTARAHEIVDIAAERLTYTPLGVEGTRDILAATAAPLAAADPDDAQAALNEITGQHIHSGTSADQRRVLTIPLMRILTDKLGQEGTRDMLALVAAATASPDRDQTAQHLAMKVGTELSPGASPARVREVLGRAYERLSGRTIGERGAQRVFAVVNTAFNRQP